MSKLRIILKKFKRKTEPIDIAAKIFGIFYPLIHVIERKYLKKYGEIPLQHPVVFVIGAPRTGSTLFNQIITNVFNVNYIDNISHIFYKNLFTGCLISRLLYQDNSHNSFKSYYGRTVSGSLHAPSECGNFWYQWMKQKSFYIGKNEFSFDTILKIRKIIVATTNYFSKPFIFTNNNAALRMGLLSEILPEAKFIFIRRDPVTTAQSLINARKAIMGNREIWWSLKPKNYEEIVSKYNYPEQVVHQIHEIENQVYTDAYLFPKENFLEVTYESLCLNIEDVMKQIEQFIGGNITRRTSYKIPILKLSNKQTVEDKIFYRIKTAVQQLYWHDYPRTT